MAKKMNVEQLSELLTKIKQQRRDNATKKNATNQDENDCGSTELIKAVRNNDEKKVKSIIEQSNHLNVTDDLLNKKLDKDGRSALHESCKSGYHDIAHYLIINNANVDLSDNMGRTPLHLAVIHGNSSLPLGRLHLEWKDGQLCYKEIPNSNCKVVKQIRKCCLIPFLIYFLNLRQRKALLANMVDIFGCCWEDISGRLQQWICQPAKSIKYRNILI